MKKGDGRGLKSNLAQSFSSTLGFSTISVHRVSEPQALGWLSYWLFLAVPLRTHC